MGLLTCVVIDVCQLPSGAKSKLPPACIWQRPKGFDLAPGGLVFGTCQIQVIGLTFGTKATLTSHAGEADSSQTTLHLALSGAPAPSSSAQRRGHASDEAYLMLRMIWKKRVMTMTALTARATTSLRNRECADLGSDGPAVVPGPVRPRARARDDIFRWCC